MSREKVLNILTRICDSKEIMSNPDVELYTKGLLDSFGTVQFIVALEEELNISVSITEIDRELWATPNKIIDYLEANYPQ
ncbi:MAG TPA: D-alanine--poly(phosphoribitol) ligase subunit 2 [Firmicutes bacterium]|nr:D-alanine--poly(phosphoribitol) ligase subunit 2 [Bacillota bacterium]